MAGLLANGVNMAQAAEKIAQQQKMVQCNQHAKLQGQRAQIFYERMLEEREQALRHDATVDEDEKLQRRNGR